MKNVKKRTLKIVSATCMAIFTLFATFSSAYAWFISIVNQEADNDQFYVKRNETPVTSISIHDFYGETVDNGAHSFAFDPVGVSVYSNGQFDDEARVVTLNKYLLEKPDHPVLVLYKNEEISGYESQINLKTEFAYLGANDDFLAGKTTTKAQLTALSNKVTKGYYRVVEDESNNSKTHLYQYDGTNFVSRSYASYAALDTQSNRLPSNDGKYFLVIDDEEHGDAATMYKYIDATATFDMVWCDLGNVAYNETNPLSSAVEFHTFTFTDDLEDMIVTRDVDVETFNDVAQDYSYSTQTNKSCIAIPTASFTADNRHGFTSFTDDETFSFSKQLNVFRGDVTGVTYVGVVVNYDQTALEYVFSHNLGNEALNNGLEFKCDWVTEF